MEHFRIQSPLAWVIQSAEERNLDFRSFFLQRPTVGILLADEGKKDLHTPKRLDHLAEVIIKCFVSSAVVASRC